MSTRSHVKFACAALIGFVLLPAATHAAQWGDILKPDYKRVYNPNKSFEGKSSNLDREFTIKSFPSGKAVKETSFPAQTFRGEKSAPAESKTFIPKESLAPEKSFRAGNWQSSDRNFRADEVPQKESPLSGKESPLGGKTVPQPEPNELSKLAPDARKAAPQPRIMDEETARKLIEKLYGPMGGRGQ